MNSFDYKENEILQDESEFFQAVTFLIGEEEFGFDIIKVKEIIRLPYVTRVPKSSPYIRGVINLRGSVVTVIDLRKRFKLAGKTDDKSTRIIVVESDLDMVGFIVDMVLETKKIPQSCIEPSSSLVSGGIENECIKGVGKLEDRFLVLLDIEKIISFKTKEKEF